MILYIGSLYNKDNEDIVEVIRKERFGKNLEYLYCIYCGSKNVIKFGRLYKKYKVNRYRCKNCKKTFNDLTKTIFDHSKLEPKEIISAIYLYYTTLLSIKSISKTLNRSYSTVFKILRKWFSINKKIFYH